MASLREKSNNVLGEANAEAVEVKEARRRKPAAVTTGDGMLSLCVCCGCVRCAVVSASEAASKLVAKFVFGDDDERWCWWGGWPQVGTCAI